MTGAIGTHGSVSPDRPRATSERPRVTADLKTGGGLSLLALVAAAGWLKPEAAHADWIKAAFETKTVDDTVKAFGGLEILVANAGINIRKQPQDYTAAEWRQVIDTNLNSVFDCCQAAYPEMKKRGGGKIVTIGSMTSIFGLGVGHAYSATKGAVVQLTRSLAVAWAKDNIQVNSILPGWIDTDLTRGARRQIQGLSERIVQGWEPGTGAFCCTPFNSGYRGGSGSLLLPPCNSRRLHHDAVSIAGVV